MRYEHEQAHLLAKGDPRLLTLDAAGFAWEWLRWNPAFRAILAGYAARRFAQRALLTSQRGGFAPIGPHPLAEQTTLWGLCSEGASFVAGHVITVVGSYIAHGEMKPR